MKFTKTEWDILKHRLDVSACIWDVLSDSEPCPISEGWQDVYERCNELNWLTVKDDVDMTDNLTSHIILDCCESSTFFYEMPSNYRARYTKAAYSLEKKLNTYVNM